MYKKLKIFLSCMIFVAAATSAQRARAQHKPMLLLQYANKPSANSFKTGSTKQFTPSSAYFLPPNFYASQLSFFCRQEIKFEKLTKIPFRFRLGSVEQCDWLEGKKGRK